MKNWYALFYCDELFCISTSKFDIMIYMEQRKILDDNLFSIKLISNNDVWEYDDYILHTHPDTGYLMTNEDICYLEDLKREFPSIKSMTLVKEVMNTSEQDILIRREMDRVFNLTCLRR